MLNIIDGNEFAEVKRDNNGKAHKANVTVRRTEPSFQTERIIQVRTSQLKKVKGGSGFEWENTAYYVSPKEAIEWASALMVVAKSILKSDS